MKSFKEFLNESSKEESYSIPWDNEDDKKVSRWEKKYDVGISVDKDSATVYGVRANLVKFLSKELDFEESEFEMMGME